MSADRENARERPAAVVPLLVPLFGTLISLLLGMLLSSAATLRDDLRAVVEQTQSHGRELATLRQQVVTIERDHQRGEP